MINPILYRLFDQRILHGEEGAKMSYLIPIMIMSWKLSHGNIKFGMWVDRCSPKFKKTGFELMTSSL